MWPSKNLRSKAFTLVEIVIVIIIVGALAVTAAPKFSEKIEVGNFSAHVIPHLRSLQIAERQYFLYRNTWAPACANLEVQSRLPSMYTLACAGDTVTITRTATITGCGTVTPYSVSVNANVQNNGVITCTGNPCPMFRKLLL